MITEAEASQGKFLAKLYCLFVDFLPQGLVGCLGNINGNDIMDYLLVGLGETAPSRHKFSRDTEIAWVELESWMKMGKDWQDAAMRAKADFYSGTNGAYKRKVPSSKALGLLSKISTRIDELQISWMIGPRATLDVKEAQALADYDRLLGKDFPQCRQDMKPYLPEWAQDLTLKRTPMLVDDVADKSGSRDRTADTDDDGGSSESNCSVSGHIGRDGENGKASETSSEAGRCSEGPVQVSCRRYFDPDGSETPQQSKTWLQSRLLNEKGVLWIWCKHWASRVADAKNLQEQLIVQSLFLASIRRLRNFDEAYNLADFATPKAATCFPETLKDRDLTQYTLSMISLDELRNRFLLEKVRENDRAPYDLHWENHLLSSRMIESLKLTTWQQQMLFVYGPSGLTSGVLTDVQSSTLRQITALLSEASSDVTAPATILTIALLPPKDTIQLPSPVALRQLQSLRGKQQGLPPAPSYVSTRSAASKNPMGFDADTTAHAGSTDPTEPSEIIPRTSVVTIDDGADDFFTGATFNKGTRRKSSLIDIKRQIKRPKISDMSKDDLAEELRINRDKLRLDLSNERQAERKAER
ncbi:hypothetical protein F5B21DRAFT_510356 [Xylaria acuta]|nr:hypothetical protein F5B21DRAFT_510356 [Xylaria acuta]